MNGRAGPEDLITHTLGVATPSLQYSDPFLSFCIDLVIFVPFP